MAHRLAAEGAGSGTLLFSGMPVKPGGGFVDASPRPGGGGGTQAEGAVAEALSGKELLKPER